ncbi:hypothetical protein VTH06DRAFT_6712 [Thermothelomyces fergusii]
MDSVTPIPVAIFGKDPKVAREVCEKLLPDFDDSLHDRLPPRAE